MVIHKKIRLTLLQRKEICDKHFKDKIRVSDLSRMYNVSRPTIYKILNRGRKNDFSIHKSTNARFRCIKYGIRRLAKIEKEIEERLNGRLSVITKTILARCFMVILNAFLFSKTKRLPKRENIYSLPLMTSQENFLLR